MALAIVLWTIGNQVYTGIMTDVVFTRLFLFEDNISSQFSFVVVLPFTKSFSATEINILIRYPANI